MGKYDVSSFLNSNHGDSFLPFVFICVCAGIYMPGPAKEQFKTIEVEGCYEYGRFYRHVSPEGEPRMVNVSDKAASRRTAKARAVINPGDEILARLENGELITAKGPVFQTAIIAGVRGAKRTADLAIRN